EKMLKLFGKKIAPIQRAFIIGGGRIGERLAKRLEADSIKTKIIESDIDRCHYLSEQMDKTVVLHGDGSDQKLFLEENVGQRDVVVSVTNDDETNILVSLLAKNLGVQNTITRIDKSSYFPLLATIGIEKVVSSRLSAVSSILREVRKGKVLSDISIFGERGEFIEAIALETSDITDKPLKKISFPKGAILVCIIRDSHIMIPAGDSVVKPNDRIIMFAVKHVVKKLEKLLTVKLDFF
ncbi:MAG: NAD-binding protein, partial [Desulfobacula sp.]|nr:NAD-binding protein [Desulfobacula sp.]